MEGCYPQNKISSGMIQEPLVTKEEEHKLNLI